MPAAEPNWTETLTRDFAMMSEEEMPFYAWRLLKQWRLEGYDVRGARVVPNE